MGTLHEGSDEGDCGCKNIWIILPHGCPLCALVMVALITHDIGPRKSLYRIYGGEYHRFIQGKMAEGGGSNLTLWVY